jgi:transposase-like protein
MIYQRLRGKLKYTTTTWHMDETYVRIAGRWVYLFRAVDSHGDTVDFYLSETRDREAAKTFLHKALSNPDNRTPRLLCMDRCRIYPAAIRDLRAEGRLPLRCRRRTKRYANNRIESDHRNVKRRLRAMQGPRSLRTAQRLIQGIETVQMLRKGQIVGAKRTNLTTTSIAFALLLGLK